MSTDLEMFRSAPLQRVVAGGGTPIAYRSFGSGPPVLMVHGWPLNGATFRGLVRALSPRFRCIVVDLPGAGESPWDPETRDIFTDFGHRMVTLVDALELPRVALIGHDSGGTIARVAAAELGGRVTALCLSNTEPSHHESALVKLYQLVCRAPSAGRLLGALCRRRWFRRSPLGFGGCFGDLDHVDGEFYEACIAPFVHAPDGAIATLSHADLGIAHRLPAIHARITAPVVLAWGEADPFFPVQKGRAMLPELQDARGFHVIPKCKLFVHDECPALVASHFERVLRSASADAVVQAASA